MTAPASNTRETAERPVVSPLQAIGVIFVFGLVGPPLGGVIWFVLDAIRTPNAVTSTMPHGIHFNMFVFLLFFSYLFGSVQALCVGTVAALLQYRNRAQHISFVSVLLASFAVGALFVGFLGLKGTQTSITPLVITLALHIGAGVGCWLIVNGFLRFVRRRQMMIATP